MTAHNSRFCAAGIFMLLLFTAAPAQIVSTLLTGGRLNRPDGFALDADGNLFVANWGGGAGTTILRTTPAGVVTLFDSTSDAPDGLAFDSAGNLFVSNYKTGRIDKITPRRMKTVFAVGLNQPSALAFDAAGDLYVSNFGGGNVSRISHNGIIESFASGFDAPLGLVFDPEGNLYVSNYRSGVINKVAPDGAVTEFATVPNPSSSRLQYLVRGKSGSLYLPSYGHNKIYKIGPSGAVSVFSGTGVAGGADGPTVSAQFDGPNSIALTKSGDLIISEYNTNRIRKITGAEPPDSAVRKIKKR